jgi:SNF2 family DNA or RNA helicase
MIADHTLEEIFRRPQKSVRDDIKKLAAQGGLSWKGHKLIVDPFTSAELVYEVDYRETGSSIIQAKIKVGEKIINLDPSDDVFTQGFIQNNFLRFFSEPLEKRWIEKVFPKPLQLDPIELKSFLEKAEKQGPSLIWKNKPPKLKPDPFPVLKLQDRTGAFATLAMDYGLFGITECDLSISEHQAWEKDLLETGFIKKTVGDSHYYCPMNKVVKTLSFLLDIGWKIFDSQRKRVFRQGCIEYEASEEGDHIFLKGKISYGEHSGNLKDAFGTFTRREKFIDLSPDAVGLIEMPKEWEALEGEEIVKEGIAIKRHHHGLLEGFVRLPEAFTPSQWKQETPPDNFQGKLYDYQLEGLSWLSFLYRSHFHGLLADEMGLGKTVQLMAFIASLTIEKPILVVMPKSLLFNWRQEFNKFFPSCDVYVHTGQDRLDSAQALRNKRVILTSYTLLRQDRFLFESTAYSAVILDEAQMIKNPDSLSSQIVCRLQSDFRLAVTGTPIENRWEDLWSIFRFLMPELLGEKKESPIFEKVRKKIRPFILRRLKSDVALELPPKQEQIIWIEQDEEERTFYEQFLIKKRSALVQKVSAQGIQKSRFDILELVLRLRQVCCTPSLISGEYTGTSAKLERLLADVEEVLEGGRKALIFSQFTEMLHLIARECSTRGWRYAYLDGKTKDREGAVKEFQEDETTQLFLMSLKAGGVGLNLTSADYVFLYEPWWNDAVENQAIDRAHRVGRQDTVIARRYITLETIEEKILRLKQKKTSLAQTLLSSSADLEEFSLEDLYDLALETQVPEKWGAISSAF